MKAVFIGSDQKIQDMAFLSIRLRWPDTELQAASTAAEGLGLAEKISPNMILLHPDFTDLSLAQIIKDLHRFSEVPILVFGFQNDEMEVITALEAGADDHIRLPTTPLEIMTRIYALLRRTGSLRLNHILHNGQESPIRSGKLFINPATYEVFFNGQHLALTSTEFRLLYLLACNRGVVVQHQILERTIWGEQINSNGLAKKYIQRLRKKLGDDSRNSRWIASVHGVGYRFIGPAPSQTQAAEKIAG